MSHLPVDSVITHYSGNIVSQGLATDGRRPAGAGQPGSGPGAAGGRELVRPAGPQLYGPPPEAHSIQASSIGRTAVGPPTPPAHPPDNQGRTVPARTGETVPDRMKEQPGPRQPPQAGALARGLSDIEVALLGLLSIRPMTGYEIRHSYARGLAPWWETPRTQIYPKLRELKQRGLVRDELVRSEEHTS